MTIQVPAKRIVLDKSDAPVALGSSAVVGALRLIAYIAWTLPAMPIQAFFLLARMPGRVTFPVFYHRICCRILGLKLEVHGRPVKKRPSLLVANHTSYLDIEVLGSLIGGCFVAKSEVADWPLFGWLARLQRTVFVDRRRGSTGDQRDQINERLEGGDRLILFPEGTSSDGNRVLPFKSALFSVAERRVDDEPLTVQPVSVAYARFSNLPMDRDLRPYFAWYGDMYLATHVWRMVKLGGATVVVQFHDPVTIETAGGTRRALAEHCHGVVADGVATALTGGLPWSARGRLARLRQRRAR
jgi:1-acyl-sn-glycerol-3-phosphate acyltransferase